MQGWKEKSERVGEEGLFVMIGGKHLDFTLFPIARTQLYGNRLHTHPHARTHIHTDTDTTTHSLTHARTHTQAHARAHTMAQKRMVWRFQGLRP